MRNATNLRGFVPGITDAYDPNRSPRVSSCLDWPPYRKQPPSLHDASNSPSPPTAAFERDEGLCSDSVQLCGRCTCTLPIGVRRYSSTANQRVLVVPPFFWWTAHVPGVNTARPRCASAGHDAMPGGVRD